MKLLLFSALLFILYTCHQVSCQDQPVWTVDGRYVNLDGVPFTFRGINYSPIPIGASQILDDANLGGDFFNPKYDYVYKRDIPLMRSMNINSIRVYDIYPWKFPSAQSLDWSKETDLDHTDFLDACWNNGDKPIYVWLSFQMRQSFHVAQGDIIDAPEGRPNWRLPSGSFAWLDPAWDTADEISQTFTRNAYLALAKKYGSHPAVVGFVIGNEQNTDLVRGSVQFWSWFDETARLVKTAAPGKLTTLTLVDDALRSVFNAESFAVPNIDVWGVNSYRGTATTGFDNLFTTYAASSNRPLFIGEYGPPASTRDDQGVITMLPNNASLQADYIKVHWDDIVIHRSICSGGYIFEWNDEWWKHGNPNVQDATPTTNPSYPGGWGDEEWFGIHAVQMASENASPADFQTRGADLLIPRAAVGTVAEMFSLEVPVPEQAPPTDIVLVPYAPFGPNAPVDVPQNAPFTPFVPTAVPTGSPTPTAVPQSKVTPDSAGVIHSASNVLMILTVLSLLGSWLMF